MNLEMNLILALGISAFFFCAFVSGKRFYSRSEQTSVMLKLCPVFSKRKKAVFKIYGR
jgi:hypothetical protein